VNPPTGLGHNGTMPRDQVRLVGTTPLAGSKAGLPGRQRRVEEPYVFAPRAPRRTRRSAIDARRPHRKHELPVGLDLAPDDRLPAAIVGGRLLYLAA